MLANALGSISNAIGNIAGTALNNITSSPIHTSGYLQVYGGGGGSSLGSQVFTTDGTLHLGSNSKYVDYNKLYQQATVRFNPGDWSLLQNVFGRGWRRPVLNPPAVTGKLSEESIPGGHAYTCKMECQSIIDESMTIKWKVPAVPKVVAEIYIMPTEPEDLLDKAYGCVQEHDRYSTVMAGVPVSAWEESA